MTPIATGMRHGGERVVRHVHGYDRGRQAVITKNLHTGGREMEN